MKFNTQQYKVYNVHQTKQNDGLKNNKVSISNPLKSCWDIKNPESCVGAQDFIEEILF